MCGLTGFWERGSSGRTAEEMHRLVRSMADTMTHRGPDADGSFADVSQGVALGFRRLSILDLSPAGHQPMASASGRYELVFNGEIYNFQRLRRELELADSAPAWRGSSDTEVLLACFEAWGIQPTLEKAVGMFAMALWDTSSHSLTLIRDRLGVKPLYVAEMGRTILFGSQLLPLKRHPHFRAELDMDALELYFRHNCIPAPYTVYRDCRKVLPGTFEVFGPGHGQHNVVVWWDPARRLADARQRPFEGSLPAAADRLEELVEDATRLRMLADVPVGAFLSGGIDSSTTVAFMQRLSALPVKTFTIGFKEAQFDETAHARRVAEHLGTDHTELCLTAAEVADLIPKLPHVYDEPFADSSQIPTYLVSQIARSRVTVALSGDGGDELFAGYGHHQTYPMVWNWRQNVPSVGSSALSALMRHTNSQRLERILAPLRQRIPSAYSRLLSGDKLSRLATVMGEPSFESFVATLLWQIPESLRLVPAATACRQLEGKVARPNPFPQGLSHLLFRDLTRYLPDDILAKVDRASMGVSLEVRSPFLDHRVAEFAWSLPDSFKLHGTSGKWVLRHLLHRYVPAKLVERPKVGFAIPVAEWLTGPLRFWVLDMLSPARLRQQGILDPQATQGLWDALVKGKQSNQTPIWSILMFQAWLEANRA